MDFLEQWKTYCAWTDASLQTYLNDETLLTPLREAMAYSIFAGGKRLRPTLCLASAALFGDAREALVLACAMEMIHTYSLIHDDLPAMDDDSLRRGRPTSHIAFGEALAILAGDGLLNYAYEIMVHCGLQKNANYWQAVDIVASCAGVHGMIAGQVQDILAQTDKPQASRQLLASIHAHKTGALIKASVLSGAIMQGASAAHLQALEGYALNLGLAFQIEDDILDATGDAQTVGKSLGKDEKSDKLTFIQVYGLEESCKLAKNYTALAVESLECFDKEADFLRDMARFMLTRNK